MQQKLYQKRTECTDFKKNSIRKHTATPQKKYTKHRILRQHCTVLPISKIIQAMQSKSLPTYVQQYSTVEQTSIRKSSLLSTRFQLFIYQDSCNQPVLYGFWSFFSHWLEHKKRKRSTGMMDPPSGAIMTNIPVDIQKLKMRT